jgi:hypothetical protein
MSLRHSSGMPSTPQAFFNVKEFVNFFKSHGLTFGGGTIVYGVEQSIDSSFHQSFVVFVTQIMLCELN